MDIGYSKVANLTSLILTDKSGLSPIIKKNLDTKFSEEAPKLKNSLSTELSGLGQLNDENKQEQEKKLLEQLIQRDLEVRIHEAAHLAAAGVLAKGPAKFTFEIGPDGNQYAVEGEVNIDSAKVEGDPEATIAKAKVIKKAALAPMQPSEQDRKVVNDADVMINEALTEIFVNAKSNTEKAENINDNSMAARELNSIQTAKEIIFDKSDKVEENDQIIESIFLNEEHASGLSLISKKAVQAYNMSDDMTGNKISKFT